MAGRYPVHYFVYYCNTHDCAVTLNRPAPLNSIKTQMMPLESPDVLTVFHAVTELLVPHSAIRCAIKVHHTLNLLPGEVSHTTTAHHQTTDKL